MKQVQENSELLERNHEDSLNNKPLIGVVGGVGPEASNKFCEFLIKHKKATNDQDNIIFLHYCNPKIPDRTEAILNRGEDPTNEILKTCKTLQDSGANLIAVPCNTAHHFLPEVQKNIDAPIIDMTKVLVKQILSEYPPITKVGILATTGSIKSEIYQNYFKKVGVKSIIPSEKDQENLVMRSIYGKSGIKAGRKTLPKKLLTKAANKLIESGAEAIVLGCTEIPLVLKQKNFGIKLYDPMEITAKEIIKYVEKNEKKNVVTVKFLLEEFAKNLGKKIGIKNLDVEIAL